MLDNWETFSSNLISDPFLDEAGKFKDDLDSASNDFCDSLDSLSNEALSSKSSVTSSERIYSIDESDSLDDRATSSSNINSIYDINNLDDNEVFSPDLSLFDEAPRANNLQNWNSKIQAIETSNVSNTFISKSLEDQTALITATSINGRSRIIRLNEKSNNKTIQPIILPPESKIVKMTVVSASTPVSEAIKAAGIGIYSTQLKAVKIREQPKQLTPTKIIVIKKPIATYVPLKIATTPTTNFAFNRRFKISQENEEYEWEKDMPILTREAPFQPEQLSPPATSKLHSKASPILECPKCQKKLPTKHAFAKHLHIHEPARFKCSQCEKVFYDRSKLRRHQVVHSAEKRYECGICGNKFSLEHNLRIHLRIHQGLTPYFCAECNHGFTQLAHFRNHIRVHSQKAIKQIQI